MDILISSNLERLIYRITGEDAAQTKVFMDALSSNGEYTITKEMMEKLSCFVGGYAGYRVHQSVYGRSEYHRSG